MPRVAERVSLCGEQNRFDFHSAIKIITLTGESGAGKGKRINVLENAFPGLPTIRSQTTRALRPFPQDREYTHMSRKEYAVLRSSGQLLWDVQLYGNDYGTICSHIDDALLADTPSLMHVCHDKVEVLQRYVKQTLGYAGVLSFYVACSDPHVLKRRIVDRASIEETELRQRVHGCITKQRSHLGSGDYHVKIDSRGNKSDQQILEELVGHLRTPIPRPQKFTL